MKLFEFVFYVLLLSSCEVAGDIMSIGDNIYPYIMLLDPAVPVVWNRKYFAQRMAASQGVRVNSRGIRFISSQYSVINVDQRERWLKVECVASMDSLCVLNTNSTIHGRVFPNFDQVAYSSFRDKSKMAEDMHAILYSECTEASTGRFERERCDASDVISALTRNPQGRVDQLQGFVAVRCTRGR
jgi:hypothetical protein